MRDFLPADVRRRAHVIRQIADVYARYGFEPLETPAVENLDTLMGKYGEEGNQLIFKVMRRGEDLRGELDKLSMRLVLADQPEAAPNAFSETFRHIAEETRAEIERLKQGGLADLALRYDLTVPLARVVAEYRAQLPKFFKRYQIQPVWRADRPARGRFREFYQCDVDVLGSKSMVVEAELCAAVSDVLVRLGFTNFVIRVNHRQILNGVLDASGIPAALAGDALVAVDKLDKIGREGVDAELRQRGISPDAAAKLLGLFEQVASESTADRGAAGENKSLEAADATASASSDRAPINARLLAQLETFVGEHTAGQRGLTELRELLAFAAATSAAGRIAIDPSLARGLSYYTGAIMEIAVPEDRKSTTSELQSRENLVCRLLLEKKKKYI